VESGGPPPNAMVPPPAAAPSPVAQAPGGGAREYVRAVGTFDAQVPDDLSFRKGDIITVLQRFDRRVASVVVHCACARVLTRSRSWIQGELQGRTGLVPETYVEPYTPSTTTALSAPSAPCTPRYWGECVHVRACVAALPPFGGVAVRRAPPAVALPPPAHV
jgi:hypothetical protein